MKKILIIFINILLLIMAFIIVDYCAYRFIYKNEDANAISPQAYFSQIKQTDLTQNYIYSTWLRRVENPNSNKKPIVIFGCSFAWGHNLNDNETFSHQLAQLTGRPVYNRALKGMGTQYMLYQLQNDEFYNIVPKPEYVIYVYMKAHIPRVFLGGLQIKNRYVFYKKNNRKSSGNLVVRDYLKEIIFRSYFINLITHKLFYDYMKNKPSKNEIDFLKLHILQSKKEIEKHWDKDVKFVIIFYEPKKYMDRCKFIIPDLEKAGITVVSVNNLSDINFRSLEYQLSEKDVHPNAKAWKILTHLLVKNIGL